MPNEPQTTSLWARIVGVGEDPMSWSFPIGRVGKRGDASVALRVHLIWPIFVIAELLWSLPSNRLGMQFVAILLGGLLTAVVVREAARLLVRTALDSKPDKLVFWPLGEWSVAAPMSRDVAIAAGGLLATFVLAIVSASTLVLLGAPRVIEVFNPLMLNTALASLTPSQVPVWALYASALVLLTLNLCPAYPLDGGRVLAALLARGRDGESARAIAGLVGMIVGGLVAIGSLASGSVLLLAFGVVILWTSFVARQRARFLAEPDELEWLSADAAPPPSEHELDALLDKISRDGIESLTEDERGALKRASERSGERAS